MSNTDSAFLPLEVMQLKLRNRFIRSATLEDMAVDGRCPGEDIIRIYDNIAAGGVGLISVSATLPDPSWGKRYYSRQLMLHETSDMAAWKELVQTVRRHGAKLSLQMSPSVLIGGMPAVPFKYRPGLHVLTVSDIKGIVAQYSRMAALAREIGMDAVQVHAGHGYCLSKFLSPFFNRRDDNYGGLEENRVRLFVEIRQAIANTAGPDFPVWIKMNVLEGIPEGLTPDIAATYGVLLAAAGYGMIECSGGCSEGNYDARGPRNKAAWFEGYFLKGSAIMKAATNLPVAVVGGVRTLEMVNDIINSRKADLISLSRPLICEPALINRWAGGDTKRARCISCDGCTRMREKGKGILCILDT